MLTSNNSYWVAIMSLRKTKFKGLLLNLPRRQVFEGVAKLVSENSSNTRIYLPKEWDGKKVFVVLKDEQK